MSKRFNKFNINKKNLQLIVSTEQPPKKDLGQSPEILLNSKGRDPYSRGGGYLRV